MRESNPLAKFIIMSHAGPYCNTSIGKNFIKTEYDGSLDWNNVIEENKDNIVMFLHGHTHRGAKSDLIHGVEVLNPGPFIKKNYGIYYMSSS